MEKRRIPASPTAKSGDINDARARYGMGRNAVETIAEKCGAKFRVGRLVRYNFSKMDAYIDELTN